MKKNRIKNALKKIVLTEFLFCLSSCAFAQTFQGSIQILIEDNFEKSIAYTVYQLRDNSHAYHLKIPQFFKLATLHPGDQVTVEGELNDRKNAILVESIISNKHYQRNKKKFLENRSVLTLLINFNDKKATNTVSTADIDALLFARPSSINDLYRISSFGQTQFERVLDASGNPSTYVVNLPYSIGNTCDYVQWGNDASSVIAQSGVNVNAYKHRLYIIPMDVGCNFGGVAYLDCAPCEAWARAYIPLGNAKSVMAHEMGHNFGVRHAATDFNNDDVIDNEYGDTSCPMGGPSELRQFNAPHREAIGWLFELPNKVAVVQGSGRYVLTALDAGDVDLLQVLKIDAGNFGTYYVSLREDVRPFGMGSFFANRLSIHRVPRFSSYSYLIATVGSGETFTDGARRISINFQGAYQDCGAVVNVSIG